MIYTDGTITMKAGSPVVTGTGTQWKKNIHGVAPGQLISIENGAAPLSMMIRAVNSDTELVLSFSASLSVTGAKYSIATTVPDTISDAARTMSANQGYIVYFLAAMQQWMTDTGTVEVELPNGQKVTLDSIKAMNDAVSKIPKVVQETGKSKDAVMSQDATTTAINTAVSGIKIPEVADATTKNKGVVQLTDTIGTSTTLVPHEKAVGAALEKKADKISLGTAAGKNAGTNAGDVMEVGAFGVGGLGEQLPDDDFNKVVKSGIYGPAGSSAINAPSPPSHAYAPFLHMQRNSKGEASQLSIYGTSMKCRYRKGDGVWLGWMDVALFGGNIAADNNGFIKKASPIIQIQPDCFETNDESEGAEVCRTGLGQYHIAGVLGYNSDGAWGVNGGISVPKDNNGLELVYVADRVLDDGSIIIETCHRQHAHLPARFQNWRLKEITPAGDRIFYEDGEPCDLPEYTRLDVRVEMPVGSVWNVKQRELSEQMAQELAEREAQETAEQAGGSEE